MCELLVMNIDKIKQTTDTIIIIIIIYNDDKIRSHGHKKQAKRHTRHILQTKTGCNKAASYIYLRRVRKGEVLLILILIEDSRGILHMTQRMK